MLVVLDVPENLEENLLGEVGALLLVIHHPEAMVVDPPFVFQNQILKRRLLAGLEVGNQLLIAFLGLGA